MQSTFTTNSKRNLLVLLLINFLSATVLYAQTPVTSITDYAIWGSSSAQIGSSSIKGGAIGSYTLVKSTGNMISGATGSGNNTNIYSGGTITLANSNVVNGNMTAGIFPLASTVPSGTIFSAGTSENFTGNIDVYGNIVIGGGTVTGSVKTPTSYKLGAVTKTATGTPNLAILPQLMPVITDFSLIYPTVGTQKITSGPIGPGNYGDLSIGNNSTVTLNGPGIYVFKSITTTGPNSSIVFNFNSIATGNFLIYVYGDVILNRTSCSITNAGAGAANRIFTEVHGTGSTNGGVTFSMSNGSNGVGNTSSWFGSVWAPKAAIKIGTPNGPSMAVQGALWSGTQVNIIDGVSIVYNPTTVNTCGSPTITAQPTPPAATCAGSGTQTLSIVATGTGLTYSWRKGGVAVTNGGTVSGQGTSILTLTNATVADAGNYDVVVGGTCGTTTSNFAAVTVNALPTISGNLNVCVGSITTLTGSGTPATLTPWVSSNTTFATISGTGVVTAVGTVSGTSIVTYKNNNGCTTTATVTVNPLPTVIDLAGPDKPFNFDGITTIGNPNLTGFTFKWIAPPGGLITTADDQASIRVAAPGIYKLALKSALGCTSTDDVLVSNKIKSVIGSELTSIYYNNPNGDPSPFFIINKYGGIGYVRIDIIVQQFRYDYVLGLLGGPGYGLINTVTNGLNGAEGSKLVITGDYPIANLLKLNDLYNDINFCRPFYAPFTNSGLVTSAGDKTMRSNLVRSGYKISGAGVKIGVISNSFNTITSANVAASPFVPIITGNETQTFTTNTAAIDLSNDDLPNVTVLPQGEYPGRSTDEGRAMLQIVHDVAPGAGLYFRTGFLTAGDFAKGIKDLKAAGCNIIVDDVTYITEPYLKDGVVAKAVDEVKAQGVTYFSAAGNFANKSYEKDFTPTDAASAGFPGKMAHDFSGTGDIFQHITLPPGDYTIVLQWVDDIYSTGQLQGTKYDLDMFWRTMNTDGTFAFKGFNRDNSNGDPLEILPFTITANTSADFVIVNNSLATIVGNPARIKYIIYRGDVQIGEYNVGNSTVVGQANAAGAIAVGASRYDKAPPYLATPLIESFSSYGGTKTEGVIRNKPDLTGPDGGNTTVKMGQDYPNSALDGYSNFFGTSAAAPHAAAVAALVMEGKKKFLDLPTTPPDDIRSLLQTTAVDMEISKNLPGSKFDFISGFGMVDADSAMRTFASPSATLIDVVVPALVVPCNGPSFTVTITGENFNYNTIVMLVNAPGDTTKIVPKYINSSAVEVTVSSCVGNPEILAYTPPKDGTNGTDGGFSNSKYFFSAAITVTVGNITKKYGETLVAPSAVIKVNGILLQNTSPLLSLQDIGLDNLVFTTAATTGSDVGTYIITPSKVTNVELQKQYSYQYFNGTVSIAKMPLRVTPENKIVTYGQSIGNITYKYKFDETNVPNPAQLTNDIKTYHQGLMPTNALAVVKDFTKLQINGSVLDTTKLRNMNLIASLNAVKNSRKFTLSNNTLIPIPDGSPLLQNNLNIQYLVDVASESIYDYRKNPPPPAKFYTAYPGLNGVNPKALLSAAAMESDDNNIGTADVNGSILKVVSGSLELMVNTTNGPVVPLLNGNLVQVVDAVTEPASVGLVQYVNDGSWVQISGDGTVTKLENASLKMVDGSIIKVVSGITYAQIANSLVKVVSGSIIKVVSGTNTVVYQDGTSIADGTLVALPNSLVKIVSGSIIKVVSGSIIKVVSGSIIKVVSGSILKVVSSGQLGTDAPNNNTAVILDQEDAGDGSGAFSAGSMFGINMITGLDAGKQYLVPGVLANPNFDVTYGLGEVDITKAQITVTAAPNTKIYDGSTSAAALPTITTGSLAGGDVAVFKETYDNKNQGSGKTMTPAVVSIVDALNANMMANYNVTLGNSTNGVISKLDITVTGTANTKTYDGTTTSAALPTITTGSLVGGDVAVFKETYDNKNQGSGKTLTPAVVSIVDALNAGMIANYNVILNSSTNGVINKRDITVTSAANTKTYNGTITAVALPTITAGTLASGDVAVFSETYDNKDQGSGKTMTPAVVSIVDALGVSMMTNYTATLNSSTNGVINKASLIVRADDKTRKFGENNPVFTVSYSGFVNSEDSLTSGIKGVNGTGIPSASTTASQYSPVSPPTYAITAGIGTLASTSNYAYSFVNGALTITTNQCLITHDATNFVSTSNPGTATSLWLNMTVKVSGQLKVKDDYLIFRAGSITFNSITSSTSVTDLSIPNGKIIADNVSSPITSYDAATNTWITRVPLGYSSTSDIFVTGAIINSSTGFAAKNSKANSVLKGMFYSNKSFSDQWSYAMGAYRPVFAYSAIDAPGEVASINGTYRAGTPITEIAYIVGGGTGNGGSNYTGSSSNQNSFTACIPSSSSDVNRAITSTSSLGAVRQIVQEGLFSKEKMDVYPNPATNNVMLSFVPANTGISKITLLTIDGKRVMEINNGISEAGKNYTKNIDVSKLIRGVYMIQLNTGDRTTIKKIIINR